MLFDSHCHLDDPKFDDAPEVIERARSEGVTRMISIGCGADSTRKAVDIASAHEGVWAAAGVHPNDAHDCHTEEAFAPIAELARSEHVVAIGETGLDYYRDWAKPEHQKALLSLHVRLATETGKPLSIHCRDAHPDFYAQISSEMSAPVRGVMHCFSGSAEDAKRYLDLGFHISIAGPVTYPNAERFRKVVAGLPLDRLLVETDAPYLAPQEFRGKRNEPAYVRFTARRVAGILGVTFDTLCEATTRNARALFEI